jgi:fused signal recognition particle receptor
VLSVFGILKKKLSKAVESISKKLREKEEKKEIEKEQIEEQVEQEPIVEKIEQPIIETEEHPLIEEVETEPAAETVIPKPKLEPGTVIKPEVKKEEIKPEKEAKPVKKKSFFKKALERVTKKIIERKLEKKDLMPILNDLEIDLIESDVAVDVAKKIKNDLINELVGKDIKRGNEKDAIINAFRKSLIDILSVPELDLKKLTSEKKPLVVLFLGFNGSGKTTSIAKLANWLKKEGFSSVLAAADTFRAASLEQLEEHANNIGVKMIKHKYGADPAAVVYDAVEHAKAKKIDFVLADSAGRVHTNQNLMQELEKIVRVNKPDLKILVIDSLTGNDALLQAESFGKLGVDGVIFTKVDVNEKGGAILSVTHLLKKPILFLGVGQRYEEFEDFQVERFVNNLIGSTS